jgi:ATP-binding cassette subfamily C protein
MKLLAGPFLELVRRTPILRRSAAICVALALIASAAEIAAALSLLPILASLGVSTGTDFVGTGDRMHPAGWLLLFAVAALLRSGVNWLSSVQTEHGTQELVISLQSRLYRALASAHWDVVRRLAPPNITSALQTLSYDAGYGFGSLVQLIAATMLVLGYLLSSSAVFPLMLPVLLVLLGLMWWLNAQRSTRVLVHSEDYHEAQTELHRRYEDWVAISRIASLGVDTGSLAKRFEAGAREAASHAVGFSRTAAATRISYDAALVVTVVVGVPVAWWLETPPALLVFALVVLVRVLPQANAIHVGYQGVINAVAPMQTIQRLAEELESDPVAPGAAHESLEWQKFALTNVGVQETLQNDGRRWTLGGASLELQHGEWLAVTGPTGAGKTTLADVMLMLIRPDAGELRIDGQIVDEELAGRWRGQSAYVPQDVLLFDAAIRDNLRLYAPDASDAELEAALRKSAAEFVTERLPEGLDTRCGPGGRWLSGGERQRIGIARALLRKPSFLVLDEPTAALDNDTQERLMDALSKLEHTMSVVIITHRPELMRLADRIIGIEDGRITRRDDGFRRSDRGLHRS